MTKRPIRKLDAAEVKADFPIEGRAAGWYFRQQETSPGAYLVEGTDLFGRRVSRQGDDPEQLLKECAEDAARINKQLT